LDEVLTIFLPSRRIKIGDDEFRKHWETCPQDQALMKRRLKLSMNHRAKASDKWINTCNGRKLTGWDEILQGGLTEGATS
jgi:hexosaminidase